MHEPAKTALVPGCCLLDLTEEVGEVTTEEMAELSAENLVGV